MFMCMFGFWFSKKNGSAKAMSGANQFFNIDFEVAS